MTGHNLSMRLSMVLVTLFLSGCTDIPHTFVATPCLEVSLNQTEALVVRGSNWNSVKSQIEAHIVSGQFGSSGDFCKVTLGRIGASSENGVFTDSANEVVYRLKKDNHGFNKLAIYRQIKGATESNFGTVNNVNDAKGRLLDRIRSEFELIPLLDKGGFK